MAGVVRHGVRDVGAVRWTRDLQWFTRDRGFAMGIRQTGVPLGGVVGSLLLPAVGYRFGYQAALAVSGIICIVVAVVCIRGYSSPPGNDGQGRIRFREVLRGLVTVASSPSSICLNLLCASLVAVQYTAVGFLAIALITQKHAPLSVAIEAMAIFQIGAILGRLAWGSVSDHVFQRRSHHPDADHLGDDARRFVVACALGSRFCVVIFLWPARLDFRRQRGTVFGQPRRQKSAVTGMRGARLAHRLQ